MSMVIGLLRIIFVLAFLFAFFFCLYRFGRKAVLWLLRPENRLISNGIAVFILIACAWMAYTGSHLKHEHQVRSKQYVEELHIRLDEKRTAYDSVVVGVMPATAAPVVMSFFYNLREGLGIEVFNPKADAHTLPSVGDTVRIHRDKNDDTFMCDEKNDSNCFRVKLHKLKAYYYSQESSRIHQP